MTLTHCAHIANANPMKLSFACHHHLTSDSYLNPIFDETTQFEPKSVTSANCSTKTAHYLLHTHFIISMAEQEYEDLMPVMADKLEADVFVEELCGWFRLLVDEEKGKITAKRLRRNAEVLRMGGMAKEEAEAMVREGDLDGDGALNEMEFCILMVRLSHGMMEDAEALARQRYC